jgi:hypothetical protein
MSTAVRMIFYVLIFLSIIVVAVYNMKSKNKVIDYKLFGSGKIFWLTVIFLIATYLIIIALNLLANLPLLPLILIHFSIMIALFIGNSFYKKISKTNAK